jgi:lipopolysaccharide transport protein LptA
VELTRDRDRLTAERLNLEFGADDVVHRAQAVGGIELATVGELPGATVAGAGSGQRRLSALRLDISFRPDRTVSEAVAGPDAELVLQPGPGEPNERRRLKGRFLTFRFDEQGRLSEVQGQRDSSFSAEPLGPGKEAPRALTCQSFVARLDPVSGQAETIEFNRDVEFVQGGRKASAQQASYDGEGGMLLLKESPVVTDEDRGWRLAGQIIHVGTRSGDVLAQNEVRNTMRSARPGAKGFLSGPDAVATCRLFEYTEKTRTAIYREDALLRSGKDEVRAREIRVQELENGRRLEADGEVTSLLHPRGAEPGTKAPAPVEARARDMRYDEAAARVVYRGEVTIRQGDIETRSPEATLTLTADGAALDTLVAGEPVEVRQGARFASGRRGTYTPADETMVLVGETVLLKDPSQELQGRSVTFHVGDDRVLVDGRQEVRTQAVFKKGAPQP